jgi:hypothetical protein
MTGTPSPATPAGRRVPAAGTVTPKREDDLTLASITGASDETNDRGGFGRACGSTRAAPAEVGR